MGVGVGGGRGKSEKNRAMNFHSDKNFFRARAFLYPSRDTQYVPSSE